MKAAVNEGEVRKQLAKKQMYYVSIRKKVVQKYEAVYLLVCHEYKSILALKY